MLLARMLFEVVAHELDRLEGVAIRPLLFGQFVFGRFDQLAFVIKNDLHGPFTEVMRDIVAQQQAKPDRRHKEKSPINHHVGIGGTSGARDGGGLQVFNRIALGGFEL